MFLEILFSSIPTTLCVAVIAGLISYFVLQQRREHKVVPPPPPSPPLAALPVHATIYQYDEKKHYHEQLFEWSKLYGPIVTFQEGVVTTVTLNRIDVVLEAMVKRQADFAGRPQDFSSLSLTEGGKDIAFGQYGPTWRLHRKIATKALRHYMSGADKMESRIDGPVSYAIEELKKEKEPFDPYFHMGLMTINITCGLCFGKSYTLEDETFRQMIDWLDVINMHMATGFAEDSWPALQYSPTEKFQKVSQYNYALGVYLYTQLYEHKATFSPDNIRDLTDTILLAQQEAIEEGGEEVKSQVTDVHINETIGDIFIAGVDAPRLTLYWTLLYLAANPEVQSKVHKELDDVLNGKSLPRISDRRRMPYTEATLYESMRLGSVAPIGLPHETICDSQTGGYRIPKGTTVYINHWALNRDPDQWKDVETFNPERFLDDTGKMAPKPESFLPFSAGRRICLGEIVVKPELHLILAGLMRKFKVSLPPGAVADFRPELHAPGQPKRYKILMEERQ